MTLESLIFIFIFLNILYVSHGAKNSRLESQVMVLILVKITFRTYKHVYIYIYLDISYYS